MSTPGSLKNSDPLRSPSPKFKNRSDFYGDLKKAVSAYLEQLGLTEQDSPRMVIKSIILLGWLIGSYFTLVFLASYWWQVTLCSISLGLAMAGVGFCIQHDGNHGSYSKKPWRNRLAGMTLDLLGGSSYIWSHKHNVVHHTFTNIVDHDDDIALGFLGRVAPEQPRLWFHRFQKYYLWFLYGFVVIKWQLVDDYVNLYTGKIGAHPFKRPRGLNLVQFVGGKAVFMSLAFVIPSLIHPISLVALTYFGTVWFMSFVLAITFVLAHVVKPAEFPTPEHSTGTMELPFAEHQVRTTANFAPGNPILTWYLGGLNYQVEHHLFPWISHIHYPRISPIVRSLCEKYKLPYNSHSLFQAIASHYYLLDMLGRPTT